MEETRKLIEGMDKLSINEIPKSVDEVHQLVPKMTLEEVQCKYGPGEIIVNIMYISNLFMRGELSEAKEYIGSIRPELIPLIFNMTIYDNYFGTLLHVLTYWNNSEEALKLYVSLRNLRAIPLVDYYEQMPYEQTGYLYVTHSNRSYGRNPDDFIDFYKKIKELEKNNE